MEAGASKFIAVGNLNSCCHYQCVCVRDLVVMIVACQVMDPYLFHADATFYSQKKKMSFLSLKR
jgi:hypothetical protein